MATSHLKVIAALCKYKDIGILYAERADDLFADSGYDEVWEYVKAYHNRYSGIPDFSILAQEFGDLSEPSISAPTEFYLDELKNDFLAKRIESIIEKTDVALRQTGSPELVLAKAQQALSNLNKYSSSAKDNNIMDFDDAETHYERMRKMAEEMGGTPGIPFGVDFIDSAYTAGMMPGDLVVVLGFTGRMKSFFTTLMACNAHECGYTPLIASLEMSAEKIRDRVFTIKGSGLFRNSLLTLGEYDLNAFDKFKDKQKDKPEFIIVTDTGSGTLTPNLIESKIDQYKPKIVFIDYAQLASDNANSESMTHRMMNMSVEYKRLALKKKVVVVLISSATGDGSAVDGPPMIEQVAWSKQLAYDADLAFAVHKHDAGNLVEIACRKNRNGPQFSGMIDWDVDAGILREVDV